MPAPRKRASQSSTGGSDAAESKDETPEISVGDLSHLSEAAERGYIGELGDEGTNPNRQD